jgi:predicted DNA-binding transcriptional regulator AlpA
MMTAETTSYLDEAEAARVLHIGRRTLQRWRVDGNGPPYCRLGVRRVLYPADALRRWAEARTYAHRAAEIAADINAHVEAADPR